MSTGRGELQKPSLKRDLFLNRGLLVFVMGLFLQKELDINGGCNVLLIGFSNGGSNQEIIGSQQG